MCSGISQNTSKCETVLLNILCLYYLHYSFPLSGSVLQNYSVNACTCRPVVPH